MKKTLLTAAVLTFASASAFAGTDGWYVGLKAGYNSWAIDTTKDYRSSFGAPASQQGYTNDMDRSSFTGGIFGGYNFNKWFGVEAAYDYVNNLKFNNGSDKELWANNLEVALRVAFPVINDDLEIFTKYGVNLYNVNSNYAEHKNGVSPLLGIGVQYYFTDNIFGRVEYDWLHNLGTTSKALGARPDANLFTLGIGYSFGSRDAAPVVVEAPAPAAPQKKVINEKLTLDADVLFKFDKSDLSVEGQNRLGQLADDINGKNIENRHIAVVGHADRIGKAAYNQKLSEKRANTVAGYLNKKGVTVDSVEGRGSTQPVTGSECKGLKRAKLVKCYARDRRVDVNVQGTITITQEVTE